MQEKIAQQIHELQKSEGISKPYNMFDPKEYTNYLEKIIGKMMQQQEEHKKAMETINGFNLQLQQHEDRLLNQSKLIQLMTKVLEQTKQQFETHCKQATQNDVTEQFIKQVNELSAKQDEIKLSIDKNIVQLMNENVALQKQLDEQREAYYQTEERLKKLEEQIESQVQPDLEKLINEKIKSFEKEFVTRIQDNLGRIKAQKVKQINKLQNSQYGENSSQLQHSNSLNNNLSLQASSRSVSNQVENSQIRSNHSSVLTGEFLNTSSRPEQEPVLPGSNTLSEESQYDSMQPQNAQIQSSKPPQPQPRPPNSLQLSNVPSGQQVTQEQQSQAIMQQNFHNQVPSEIQSEIQQGQMYPQNQGVQGQNPMQHQILTPTQQQQLLQYDVPIQQSPSVQMNQPASSMMSPMELSASLQHGKPALQPQEGNYQQSSAGCLPQQRQPQAAAPRPGAVPAAAHQQTWRLYEEPLDVPSVQLPRPQICNRHVQPSARQSDCNVYGECAQGQDASFQQQQYYARSSLNTRVYQSSGLQNASNAPPGYSTQSNLNPGYPDAPYANIQQNPQYTPAQMHNFQYQQPQAIANLSGAAPGVLAPPSAHQQPQTQVYEQLRPQQHNYPQNQVDVRQVSQAAPGAPMISYPPGVAGVPGTASCLGGGGAANAPRLPRPTAANGAFQGEGLSRLASSEMTDSKSLSGRFHAALGAGSLSYEQLSRSYGGPRQQNNESREKPKLLQRTLNQEEFKAINRDVQSRLGQSFSSATAKELEAAGANQVRIDDILNTLNHQIIQQKKELQEKQLMLEKSQQSWDIYGIYDTQKVPETTNKEKFQEMMQNKLNRTFQQNAHKRIQKQIKGIKKSIAKQHERLK